MKHSQYRFTIFSCFLGYITQAIAVNFPPLLFVAFMKDFNLSFSQLTSLITITFVIQLFIDYFVSKLITTHNIKLFVVLSQVSAIIGLIGLSFVPHLFGQYSFAGLILCACFYSAGSGLIEVAVSPIVENCPTNNKSGIMSLLHSFYCWGSAFAIGFSTLFFYFYGTENWRYLAIIWALIPLMNSILMCIMPIPEIEPNDKNSASFCFKNKTFLIMFALMLLGGAAELAVSQWSSVFAETGLNISKSAGDIAGPFLFAILMGLGRVIFTAFGGKIRLINYMLLSVILLTLGYTMAAFSPIPLLSFIGIALCGFAVAIFWPGTLSLAAAHFGSSASIFGLLAFAGDTGCTVGPLLVGLVSDRFSNNISVGLGFSLLFPIGMLILIFLLKTNSRRV